MTKQWVVTGNEGFTSERMPFTQAVRFATRLIKLGNYAVRVKVVE